MTAADAQRLFAEGVARHKQGRVAEAAQSYAQACAADPASVAAQFNHAVALQELGLARDAESAYLRSLALKPDLVQALNNLANLCIAQGRLEEGGKLLHRALAAAPEFAPPYNNLGNMLLRKGLVDAAIERFSQALARDGHNIEARINLGKALLTLGRPDDACLHLEAALAARPDDAGIRFLRDTASGAQPSRAPDAFVTGLFDEMADDFDRHLVERLGYRIPERIAEAIGGWLDARARGLYTRLVAGELVAFLAARPASSADLLVAADVFVYLGDLGPACAQAARIAAPGARFVFSVEVAGEGAHFRLQSTSRYAHGPGYVRALATTHGFEVALESAETIRTERGRPVAGYLYVLSAAVTPA